MRYCSVDIETTGLDPDTCDIIEVGMVIDDLMLPDNQKRPIFHAYVLPEGSTYRGEPYALSMHSAIFKRIGTEEKPYRYTHPDNLVQNIKDFLETNNITTATAAGKNFASFDLRFLRMLPNWNNKLFHHRILDPGSLYMNPITDTVLPDSKECAVRAGLTNTSVAHNALDDALMVIELIRAKYRPK